MVGAPVSCVDVHAVANGCVNGTASCGVAQGQHKQGNTMIINSEFNTTRDRSEYLMELFEAYYDRVYAFARKNTTPDKAEDVAQEVFIKLMEHPRLEEMTLTISYLFKIAHNLIKRGHARNMTFKSIINDRMSHRDPVIDDQDASRALPVDSEQLKEGLESLTDSERVVIRMIVCEGYSYDHVARSLGVTVSRVNNWRHRGLAKLRKHVQEIKIDSTSYCTESLDRIHRGSGISGKCCADPDFQA